MATYPCSIGLHRYGARQSSAYITVVNGSSPVTRKQRLCPDHFTELEELCENKLTELSDRDGGQVSKFCEVDDENEPTSSLFVKLYAGQQDYIQYAIDVCERHSRELLAQLRWDASIPL